MSRIGRRQSAALQFHYPSVPCSGSQSSRLEGADKSPWSLWRRHGRLIALVGIGLYIIVSVSSAVASPSPRLWQKRVVLSRPNELESESKYELNLSSRGNVAHAKIAYFIQVSPHSIYYLERLLRVLHDDDNVYAIHFDVKIERTQVVNAVRSIQTNSDFVSNVHVMKSELITPHGVSMILNTMSAMNILLEKHGSWDYFINLSAADYPLVSVKWQRKLLGLYPGLNFFNVKPKINWASTAQKRIGAIWYDEGLSFREKARLGNMRKLDVQNPLGLDAKIAVVHADTWMIVSREFCRYILRGDKARKLLLGLAYSFDGAEHYFASLAWNEEQFNRGLISGGMRVEVGDLSGVGGFGGEEVEIERVLKRVNTGGFFGGGLGEGGKGMLDVIDGKGEEAGREFENRLRKIVEGREGAKRQI